MSQAIESVDVHATRIATINRSGLLPLLLRRKGPDSSLLALPGPKKGKGAHVTGAVTFLLRVCYGSDLNSEPILPRCYGCYGSNRGKEGMHILIPQLATVTPVEDSPKY